jgi:homoserine dehydrogenase
MMDVIKVGVMGAGTVGLATIDVLCHNQHKIQQKLGRKIQLVMVASRHIQDKNLTLPSHVQLSDDVFAVVQNPDIQVVVELIGGSTDAKELVLQAIRNKKHVVTANKKLLAEYGNEIFSQAEKNKVTVRFEAAVAGGIPIIKMLREGLAANNIRYIAGIINGTSNFILSEMKLKKNTFEHALQEAQRLGYAEADPTFDIEGYDTGHKLTLMAALAFGIPIDFKRCYLEGITHIKSEDIEFANELGYEVKLLGITKRNKAGIELRVHPTLVHKDRLLASVNGVMNAVDLHSKMLGDVLYYGAGAGGLPTASAVIADLIDLARELTNDVKHPVPHLAYLPSEIKKLPFISINDIQSSYYLRLVIKDQVGVLSQVAKILVAHGISIEVMLQKTAPLLGGAQLIVLTHLCLEQDIKDAICQLESLDEVLRDVVMLRVETFHQA